MHQSFRIMHYLLCFNSWILAVQHQQNKKSFLYLQTQETQNLVNTILDVQPRLSSGGAGKSNDEIVYELADSILGKLMDKLDIELANQEMFEPDEKGRLNSLTTVLTQEVERFNKLLKVIKVCDWLVSGADFVNITDNLIIIHWLICTNICKKYRYT